MLVWAVIRVFVFNVVYMTMVIMSAGRQERAFRDLQRTAMLEIIVKEVGNTPPNFNDAFPTVVDCELFIDSFDAINEADMDFTVSVLFHLQWEDTRFLPWTPSKEKNDSYIEFDSKQLEILWTPDLFFPNEKDAFFHDVFMPNKMLRVYAGGMVSYTARLSMTLACPMKLHNYPFDVQVCSIEMESFSYDKENIILRWLEDGNRTTPFKPVEINEQIALPQFEVDDFKLKQFLRPRKASGIHSVLSADFYLTRNIGYYVVQMYIPSILVVMLSWISFWLNVQAVPGRIALGVLTVLTMTTQSSSVNASLPRVSYTKAIDIWMAVCLLFVFAALIEFAIANVLSRKDNDKEIKFRDIINRIRGKPKKLKTQILVSDDGEMRLDPKSDPALAAERRKMTGILYAMYLDVTSRFLFPLLFALFNLSYWTHYVSGSTSDNSEQ